MADEVVTPVVRVDLGRVLLAAVINWPDFGSWRVDLGSADDHFARQRSLKAA
jgi:hypothetical protein